MPRLWLKGFLCVLCLTVPLTTVQAQSDETFIEYRQKIMKGIGASMGAVGDILKHKLPYSGHIATHAHDINRLSKLITDAFKKDLSAGMTDAKPDIWQDWEKFAMAADQLGEESAKLAEVSAGADMEAIAAQVKAVGKACGGCHKPFRKPKEESYKKNQ